MFIWVFLDLHLFCRGRGETGTSLQGSDLSGCKCPQKLTDGLCLLKQWYPVLSPSMPSAAAWPLPWGGAGSGPRRVLATFFGKKRNFKLCTSKCFQEINVLVSWIASSTRPSGDSN